jgi:hypothetical protein
MSSHSIFE